MSYDNATGVFSFAPADLNNVAFSGSIDDLVDVDITTSLPTVGQALAWDGSNFVPTTIAASFDGQFSSLTGTPTTIAGYGITDAFDGAYSSLTGTPTIPSVLTDLSITDGTSGQVLTTDGAGSFSFTTVSGGSSSPATPTTEGILYGTSNSATNSNTGLGYQALNETLTGTKNVALGYAVGSNITTGNENTFIGYQAGSTTTTGIRNTAIGSTARAGEGSANVAIGYQTGKALTTANNNTLIGSEAGKSLTTGGDNVMIGFRAAQNMTGASNTIVGAWSAGSLTTGNNNTVIGRGAAATLSTGGGNLIMGPEAGKNINPGAGNNIIMGNGPAGRSVTVNMATSIAIGYRAYTGGSSGTNNVAIGTTAGPDDVTYPTFNGNNSTWIGYKARPTSNGSSNEFVCGADTLTDFHVPGPGFHVNASKTTVPGALQLEVLSAEPTPAAGMIAVADGATWDPLGTGVEQCVIYLNGAWTALA